MSCGFWAQGVLSSNCSEEAFQEVLALFFENLGKHLNLVRELRVVGEVELGTGGAHAGIPGSKVEFGNTGEDDGAHTHGAGLKRDEEGTFL